MTAARRLLPLLLVLFTFALPAAAAPQDQAAPPAEEQTLFESIDASMGNVNGVMETVIFYDINFFSDREAADHTKLPLAVALLVFAAIFFTLRMGLPQLRAFGHAIAVVRGKYDDPNAKGEVSSFL